MVEQRRDQAGHRLSRQVGRPGHLQGWLGARTATARIHLKGAGKKKGLLNIFHNPDLPTVEDYYEPFTYNYLNLIEAPPGDDQPTARPVSLITGEPMDVKMGPNWDDDLSGTPDYARNDPNLEKLTPAEQEAMFQLERMAFFYLPRICNHCLNPGCVASCPSGAIYKRGEDGIVLINQKVCRAWRMCVTACPYKKSYYNWHTGKSREVHPVLPAHGGGLRAGLHALLRRTHPLHRRAALRRRPDRGDRVVPRQGSGGRASSTSCMDPFDREVIAAAKANGVPDSTIKAAQNSPTYKFVKEWGMALPLHPEFRTLPMLFYVPPLLPVMASVTADRRRAEGEAQPHRQDVDRQLALRHQHRGALGHDRAGALPAQVHGEPVQRGRRRRPWPTGSRS